MSTTTLTYPNAIPLRRAVSLRSIILFVAVLALITSAIGVALAAATNSSPDAPLSGVFAIAVPEAPVAGTPMLPVETATPAPSPEVIAVPVPTPPSQ